jgi:hypothetical protein
VYSILGESQSTPAAKGNPGLLYHAIIRQGDLLGLKPPVDSGLSLACFLIVSATFSGQGFAISRTRYATADVARSPLTRQGIRLANEELSRQVISCACPRKGVRQCGSKPISEQRLPETPRQVRAQVRPLGGHEKRPAQSGPAKGCRRGAQASLKVL